MSLREELGEQLKRLRLSGLDESLGFQLPVGRLDGRLADVLSPGEGTDRGQRAVARQAAVQQALAQTTQSTILSAAIGGQESKRVTGGVNLGGLLIPVIFSAIPLAMILLEPDLGTALLLVPVLFVLLYVAGARSWHLALIVLIGVTAAPFAWGQIKGYQRARVTAVLLQSDHLRRAVIDNQETYGFLAGKRQALEWAASSGYQLVHSKNAIGSGGALGQGWGNGVYVRRTLLPDRHNDFVFAIIGHQWGLVGCLLVLLCYLVIVLSSAAIASTTVEPCGRLLAVGVMTLIATQVIINVGMTVGLMPITGMTLPFVSYGGSSLLTNFVAVALLISISRHRPFLLATRPFEFRHEDGEDKDDECFEQYERAGIAAGGTNHPSRPDARNPRT